MAEKRLGRNWSTTVKASVALEDLRSIILELIQHVDDALDLHSNHLTTPGCRVHKEADIGFTKTEVMAGAHSATSSRDIIWVYPNAADG